MPCPHFKITIAQRSKDQSAVASAAYQSGERLFSEYDQKVKNYSEKTGIVHTEIMLPDNAPTKYQDRQTLWNAAEKIEKQHNAQLARKIVLALPRELSHDEHIKMLRDYCRVHFVSNGMCVDFAIHDKGDGNPHAHIMLTMRAMDESGKWLPKSRKVYDLDENGERIRLPSGAWKSHKENTVDWNEQYNAEAWRHGWEVITNTYLENAGRSERVDLRSFERQGITDQAPTIHLGAAVWQLEKQGIETDMGNLNREIRRTNRLIQAIKNKIRQLYEWLSNLFQKKEELVYFSSGSYTVSDILMRYMGKRKNERGTWSAGAQSSVTLHSRPPFESDTNNHNLPQRRDLKASAFGNKFTAKDLNKVSKLMIYLENHSIVTLDDLKTELNSIRGKADKIQKTIREKESRIKDISQIVNAHNTVEKYKDIYEKHSKIPTKIFKDRYAEKHKTELEKYRKSSRLLRDRGLSGIVYFDSFKYESKKLKSECDELKAELESIKSGLSQLDEIRRIVDEVLPIGMEWGGEENEKQSLVGELNNLKQHTQEQDVKKTRNRNQNIS